MTAAVCLILLFSQTTPESWEPVFLQVPANTGFEFYSEPDSMPTGWRCTGEGYRCVSDPSVARSGLYSGRFTGVSPGGSGSLFMVLPLYYQGSQLSYSGHYLADPGSQALIYITAADAMGNIIEQATAHIETFGRSSGWQSWSLTIPVPQSADSLNFGVMLTGEGTVWLDDLELTIDGMPFTTVPVVSAATSDREFADGSGLSFPALSPFQMESLELLGRVWNFLKYHHPTVCSGAVNWDYELFRTVPGVLAATTVAERESALMRLFFKLDPVPPVASSPAPADAITTADLSWINRRTLGNALASALQEVHAARHRGDSRYLVISGAVPEFIEEAYPGMSMPDPGYRLLALYRYWGIIEFFYPYSYATARPWQEQIRESIPFFLSANSPLEYQLALARMTAATGDVGGGFLQEPGELREYYGRNTVPIALGKTGGQWVVTGFTHSIASQSPIRLGDIILEAGGRPLSAREAELTPFKGSHVSRHLLRGRDQSVELLISRGGQNFQLTLQRVANGETDPSMASVPAMGEASHTIMDDGLLYLHCPTLTEDDIQQMIPRLAEVKGIILDARGSIDESVLYQVAQFILKEEADFARTTRFSPGSPGTFLWHEYRRAGGNPDSFTGRVAVLADASSQALPVMAWTLAPDARVFGTATGAPASETLSFSLPGGIHMGFSATGIYHPNGGETRPVAVNPDTEAGSSAESLQAGVDPVLEAAVEWLQTEEWRLR